MCGRYGLRVGRPELVTTFPFATFPPTVTPRHNIAPTQEVLVLRRCGNEVRGQPLRWGIGITDAGGRPRTLINVRSETARLGGRERILIPATHFFEWRRRQPMLISHRDGMMAFAGVLDVRRDPVGGQEVATVAIFTCAPNGTMASIHDRMPVVLARPAWSRWLDPGVPDEEALALLRPCPDEWLAARPVSRLVNDPANDDERVLELDPSEPIQGDLPL
jgi:putative SOS response-associated peptidase YedK